MTPMMMMKNRKTRNPEPVTKYLQCLSSLRILSHPSDKAAEGIATKPALAVINLLHNFFLCEAVQGFVARREPRAAAGVGL